MDGCFVTGTGTGVGKTVLAGAIVAALRERGARVRALKPIVTGLAAPTLSDWPHDHMLLAAAAGDTPERVALRTFGPAVSPHLAAELAARELDIEQLIDEIRAAGEAADVLVIEGIGGLLVPLADGWDVRRLAAELGFPVAIAASSALGTINHTLLTLEAARHGGLAVSAVVLTPWPQEPDALERSNLATIARLGGVEVAGLARVNRPDRALLATAGSRLPLSRLVGPSNRPLL